MSELLRVKDLRVDYRNPLRDGIAVDGLSFDVSRGETLALVGESGCGKSTAALSMLRLLPQETEISGQAMFEGHDLIDASEAELQHIRGRHIGMVFQEPMTSLNPVYRIGWQITELLHRHLDISRRDARRHALDLLDQVGLPDAARRLDAYPHELSGGQRQRVMIAMAIALRPKLLIADEPTTALDAAVRGQILDLLDALRKDLDMGILLISHDLPMVAHRADRVVVMHHGREMERLGASTLMEQARHPYTLGLIGASIRMADHRHYTTSGLAEVAALRGPDNAYTFELRRPEARAISPPATAGALLRVEDLVVAYATRQGRHAAVDGVSFSIRPGETMGLVGESGCGKSSLSRAILGLERIASGEVAYRDSRLDTLSSAAWRPLRRKIQMIFQDPYASLNPRHTVGQMLGFALKAHGGLSGPEIDRRLRETLDAVRLPASALDGLPHEFSGGQRQRIAIARALVLRPELVICDEPVSALDVSVQAQILNLLVELKQELGLTLLFISHDLAVVRYISDTVMVMQKGRIVETAAAETIWKSPNHAYTRALLDAAA